MNSQSEASYRSYYDIYKDRSVPIRSKIGQAQFLLSDHLPWHEAQGEQLLACRFAGTIHNGSDDRELRQLQQLLRYLRNTGFEKRCGFVNPLVAREVEKEIVLRTAPDCAAGCDITPAMELLADIEKDHPVFSQAERNLILRCMFCTGDRRWTEDIAVSMREENCPAQELADICGELEQIELSWLGVDTMEGLQYLSTSPPGSQMSLINCELPDNHYPPFACYPGVQLPVGGKVLMNGTLLHPIEDDWWRSDLLKADQTYTAPHYYKSSQQSFEIADKEYELLQEETMPFESIFSGDDPGTGPETNMQQQEGGMTLG